MDIVGLIPSFGGFFYTLAAFVIALSVIVAVHEYGHYIVGRWSGIQPEVFSLGFGPVLFSRMDRRGTRWQIAALPFGGYVKFLGDANAASAGPGEDLGEMPDEMKRRTMQGAPLWARAATVAAGPVFNFILSVVVFAAVIMVRGTASEPLTIDTLTPLPAEVQELRQGDALLSVAGQSFSTIAEFPAAANLPVEPILDYTVQRGGSETAVRAPYPYPPLVSGLTPGSAAMDAGLRVGDVITAIDGTEIFTFTQLREAVGASGGDPMALDVWRGGETRAVTLQPRSTDLPTAEGGFETRYLIGVTGGLMFEPATRLPGPFESLGQGVQQTLFIVESSLSGMYHMAVGAISSCNLRGPIGIAETSGAVASQGISNFIWFIAVLSTAVGLLNLFPIPVLDGGHLVFYAYEAVRGKPPSDTALRYMMATGFALLITLMIFALSNDLFCP
ncbi:RIP metalloprotease RseP [Anianabacter salinae]|uniref:RIP metalloprotease RseP n=1 Tax=Anianabacter salinae TaxID=2851023 RepID=UPI00225E1AB7|nr:RIP metalloprotease RseP [Anianabacter salinae]MBV0911984.1 RIP metalloprotease RseP [Anianabacter salinae]